MAALSIDFLEGRSQVEVCPEKKQKAKRNYLISDTLGQSCLPTSSRCTKIDRSVLHASAREYSQLQAVHRPISVKPAVFINNLAYPNRM